MGREFLAEPLWEELASAAGLRLPRREVPFTNARMERWLRRLGLTGTHYLRWSGVASLKQFREWNPDWTMRAWAGLVLEHRDQLAAVMPSAGEGAA